MNIQMVLELCKTDICVSTEKLKLRGLGQRPVFETENRKRLWPGRYPSGGWRTIAAWTLTQRRNDTHTEGKYISEGSCVRVFTKEDDDLVLLLL